MVAFTQLARDRQQIKLKKAQQAANDLARTRPIVEAFASDCRDFFLDEVGVGARVQRFDDSVKVEMQGKTAEVRFLLEDFVLLSLSPGDCEEVPMKPDHAKAEMLEHFDV